MKFEIQNHSMEIIFVFNQLNLQNISNHNFWIGKASQFISLTEFDEEKQSEYYVIQPHRTNHIALQTFIFA